MSAALQSEGLTVEQYLADEQEREIRHEYVAGEIYAMAGTTDAHNSICGNLHAALHRHLRGGPCKLYIADVKARVFVEGKYSFIIQT
jgi:Uma2 family endonuclease